MASEVNPRHATPPRKLYQLLHVWSTFRIAKFSVPALNEQKSSIFRLPSSVFFLSMGDRIRIDPAYRQRLALLGLDCVQKVLDFPGERILDCGPQCDLYRVEAASSQQPELFIKRFNYPTWSMRLNFIGRCFFGRSRAKREFRCLRLMHRLGIQTSRALSWGERRQFGFLARSYLIIEGVPASDSLRDFAIRYFHKAGSPRGRQLKRSMMDQLADQVRLMHGKNFCHGDLTWQNILIRPTPREDFEFFLINALRGKRVWAWWKRRRLRARDLAGIDAISSEFLTRADKIRFMKRYLQVNKLSPRDRQWMAEIRQLSREINASRSGDPASQPQVATSASRTD
jgi:hypothetical protein